jgi:hypothetical protein
VDSYLIHSAAIGTMDDRPGEELRQGYAAAGRLHNVDLLHHTPHAVCWYAVLYERSRPRA